MASKKNLIDLLDTCVDLYSQRTAIIFGQKKITYSQLKKNSLKIAGFLSRIGVKKKDNVCVWLPNCPEFVYVFFGILRLGATVVPINYMFKEEEAKFIIDDASAKVVFCSIDKLDLSLSILSRVDNLEYIVSIPDPGKSGENLFGLNQILNQKIDNIPQIDISGDDIAEIVYTSGTTGRPKGACLAHNNLLANIYDCSKVIYFNRKDTIICLLPLFHSFASTVCMLLPLSVGAKIVIMRAVRPFKRVIRAIFKNRVTIFVGVPSLFNILAETKIPRIKLFLSYILNPVRLCISGAAALPRTTWEKFEKKYRRPLLQGYGLTEASPVVSLNPLKGVRKPESVGLPLPSVKVKVEGENGEELPRGEIGELLVKGPNVMKGYYKQDDETAKVIVKEWLHTGDLAKIDSDGYIYIMGRIKDMINVRGLNVYPKEIEDLLYRYPQIKEAAVVGVEHRHRGEVPVAFIVKEGEIKERDIINYLKKNLASYKVPLKIIFKDSFPRNPTGKILKRELKKEVEDLFKRKDSQ